MFTSNEQEKASHRIAFPSDLTLLSLPKGALLGSSWAAWFYCCFPHYYSLKDPMAAKPFQSCHE